MKINLNKKNLILLFICLALIILGVVADQFTKGFFENLFKEGKLPIVVVPDMLEFTFVLNDGAAWGSLSGSSILFFILTSLALPIFCYFILTRIKNGGFFNGAVRDFLATKFLGRLDFVCNVADILLNVGVILVIIGILFVDTDAIFKKHSIKEGCESYDIGMDKNPDFLYEIKDANLNVENENRNESLNAVNEKTENSLDNG